MKCIRLGHPARVSEELQRHSLEALISSSEETQLVRDIYTEIDALSQRGKRPEDRYRARQDIKELRKELKVREKRVLKELLLKAEVILGEVF